MTPGVVQAPNSLLSAGVPALGVRTVANRAPLVVGTRLVFLIFVAVQVFDGLFTYVAVDAVGIAAEGNRLLAAAMHGFGHGPTLVTAKVAALVAGLFLYTRGWHLVLALVTALYAVAAIGPWLVVYVSWGSQ